MNLYKLTNLTEFRLMKGKFIACIVCAEDADEAIKFNPEEDRSNFHWPTDPNQIDIEYIGDAIETMEKGIILASFLE